MRALLMIGNSNLSLRGLYTAVLDSHAAGWSTAFMSGMPSDAESIVRGYDLVIYELGRADTAERVTTALTLRGSGVSVMTHVEGREAGQYGEQLRSSGVVVVTSPVNGAHIEEALNSLVADRGAGMGKVSLRERFRRLLSG